MSEEKKETQKIQVRIDESRLQTTYANAFRQQSSAQEVILDFGINMIAPANPEEPDADRQMKFQIDNRLVMNYITAKRLAAMLVQIVQAHEQKFGEIKTAQG